MDIDEAIKNREFRRSLEYQSQLMLREARWASFGIQLRVTKELTPSSILEVGKGNGFYESLCRLMGMEIETLDIDENYNPTYVGNLLDAKIRKKFDLVAAFQILQHIPLNSLPLAIERLCDLSYSNIIISVPFHSPHYISISMRYSGVLQKILRNTGFKKTLKLSFKRYRNRHYRDTESHQGTYWELGRDNLKSQYINTIFERNNFELKKAFACEEYPYHYYMIFSKLTEK